MIVGFKVSKGVGLSCFIRVIKVLDDLSKKHNDVVSVPDSSVKGVSVNMVKFTGGSPFQRFDYDYSFFGDDVLFFVRVELRSIAPKIDYFFDLLSSLFGLKKIVLLGVKKSLYREGFTGDFVRLSDKEMVEHLYERIFDVKH
jgi:hypothetical protein